MALRDLSIWIGCILAGLAAIFVCLVDARLTDERMLKSLIADRDRSLLLADRLAGSVGELGGFATEYLETGHASYLSAFDKRRSLRDQSTPGGTGSFEFEISRANLTKLESYRVKAAYLAALALADRQRLAMESVHSPGLAFNPGAKARLLSKTISQLDTLNSDVFQKLDAYRKEVEARHVLLKSIVERHLQANNATTNSTLIMILFGVITLMLYFGFSVLPGFERIRLALRITAEEDFDTHVSGVTRQDEVGDMARAVVVLQEKGRKRTKALFKLAYFDTLTGLANRDVFRDRLREHLETKEFEGCLAVFMMDLDKFKEINDVYGHPAGDIVLKETARRLQETAGTTLQACRFGGDEFGIVGIVKNEAQALEIGEAMIAKQREPIKVSHGTVVTCGCTLGLATTRDQLPPDRIISQADMALYSAKEAGRGQLKQFLKGMDAQLVERRELEEDLRHATERGELSLALQPQVRLDDTSVVGFEALMRWQHPERGAVSPGVFIPIAEESRLILEIGRWSIQEACRIASQWPGHMRMSVNLSPAQFYDEGLVPFVENTLKKFEIDPERIEIEVTETVLIDDRGLAFKIMHELRATGVGLALDDFGTGFSSLSYLREFPFDKIKIDQSFVSALEEGGTAQSIVRSIIGLGKALGMCVIAEGVETPQQSEMLKEDGCDLVQGYLYGKPLPAAEVLRGLMQLQKRPALEAFEADSRAEALETARIAASKRGSAA